jgi:hypothetical protein
MFQIETNIPVPTIANRGATASVYPLADMYVGDSFLVPLEPVTLADARSHLRLEAGSGEPAPTAPTAALVLATAGTVDNGAHRYAEAAEYFYGRCLHIDPKF